MVLIFPLTVTVALSTILPLSLAIVFCLFTLAIYFYGIKKAPHGEANIF
jgi:NADH:ubiquinone oxidoreductase subunit 3 (subunit A)